MATYTKFWDVIVDQLWSYQDANLVLDSIDYLNLCFGITTDHNTGHAPCLKLDNGATHGGTINWDGGSTKYLRANAAGTVLSIAAIDFKMTGGYKIQGNRAILTYRGAPVNNEPYDTSDSTSIALGYVMPFPGSVLGVSLAFSLVSMTGTSFTEAADLYKNGSLLVAGTATGLISPPGVERVKDTYARGVHTFVAGDRLEVLYNKGGDASAWTGYASAQVEVILDS